MSINGVIVIDKPKGITSFDVVFKIRKIAGTKKVGHTGTLDPDATGVLPVCIGNATRASDLMDKTENKRYSATMRLGFSTDTDDATGRVLERSDKKVSKEELLAVMERFKGEIMQIPPMYSAIKVGGKKLYELARKGVTVEREKRPCRIFSMELLSFDGEYALFDVRCSKGTYIRTLCKDMGEALGTFAHMSDLRRTESGIFKIEDSVSLSDLTAEDIEKKLIPTDRLFSLPSLILNEKQEFLVKNGVPAYIEGEYGLYRVYSKAGEFISVSEITDIEEKKCLKLIKSFYGGN